MAKQTTKQATKAKSAKSTGAGAPPPPAPAPHGNQNKDNVVALSVSELARSIKQTVEGRFEHVRVRGEIGRVTKASSGHIYLGLKDDKAVLESVIWRGMAQKLPVPPQEGLEVICTGRVTTYAPQSRYQLIIEHIEPAGVGALMALLEARKQQLEAEGLFAAERKKPLPFLPETIGVITSPSGAVISDILHSLADRFPRHVLLWPVPVQGKTCAEEVARAIAGFNALPDKTTASKMPRPDILIIARGGGSLEDLWGFNEEIVARTAAQSDIPIISAIGHETDTVLLDFVADRRAPTPTAAAEMAVPVRADLQAKIMELQQRQYHGQVRFANILRDRLMGFARGLPRLDNILAVPSQRLDHTIIGLRRGLAQNLQSHATHMKHIGEGFSVRPIYQTIRQKSARMGELQTQAGRRLRGLAAAKRVALHALGRQLDLLSHESVLARGFALVKNASGQLVRSANQAPVNSLVQVQFAKQQSFVARVENVPQTAHTPPTKQAQRRKPATQKNAKPTEKQGDLF